jgi:hypothetical protein
MRTLIILLSIISYNAFSMRCGTSVLTEGDSLQQLQEACGQPDGSYSNEAWSAPDKLYYKDGSGTTCEVRQVGGIVTNVECNR